MVLWSVAPTHWTLAAAMRWGIGAFRWPGPWTRTAISQYMSTEGGGVGEEAVVYGGSAHDVIPLVHSPKLKPSLHIQKPH